MKVALSSPGGASPLVICSDCYDNANIYSRTRDYCPYAYLGEDDALDKPLPSLRGGFGEHGQHEDRTLESLISNHEKRLSSQEHFAHGEAPLNERKTATSSGLTTASVCFGRGLLIKL